MKFKTLILAAGKGTRMKSKLPKVLFEVAGKSMINYVINSAKPLNPEDNIVVIGNAAEKVKEHLRDEQVSFALQENQRGTADAVLAAEEFLKNYDGKILILCGDMPLMKTDTLEKFIKASEKYDVAFISVDMPDPKGYGRVVRSVNNEVIKIVEEKDADDMEKRITEVNTGVYLASAKELLIRLKKIDNNNAQGEFYLTDIVNDGAFAYKADNFEEFIGINDRKTMSIVSKIIWRQRAEKLMSEGVSILDLDTCYLDENIKIGKDTVVYPNVFLQGDTEIGENCVIYPGVRIKDSIVESNCEIKDNTLITESFIGSETTVGPMAQLRPGTKLLGNNKIGNFVETKKAVIGKGSKASHLTYLGDAELGEEVNIGCGTITCNYDGINKHKTIIGNRVFVGSDVQLVAPVKVEDDALIAAGSTITKDVPPNSLGITRSTQKNIEGWVKAWKSRQKKLND
jgi:bifunctional UDP-N-acetylglucosamine pyrophosphorylase/glucosamine-1-phosphate N-acetyltransferase